MSYTEEIIHAIEKGQVDEIHHLVHGALLGDSVEELYQLLDIVYQVGFNEESYMIAKYLDSKLDDDEMKIILSEISFDNGEDVEGLQWLQKINKNNATYPKALLVMADYYQSNGFPEVSEQKLKEAEEILPQEPIIQFALAELYYFMQEWHKAEHYYQELIKNELTEIAGISLKSRLAAIQGIQGELDEAVHSYQEAVETHPHIDTHFQLGFLYFQKRDFDKAELAFKEVLALDPNYWAVYPLLVKLYIEKSEHEKALEAVNLGIMRDELNSELYLLRAELYLHNNDFESAVADFESAIQLDGENDLNYLRLIDILMDRGDDERIITLIQTAPESIKKSPEIMWHLAQAYNHLEELSLAADTYAQAAGLLQTDEQFLKDYYDFLIYSGDSDKSQHIGKRYMRLNPDDYEFEEQFLQRFE
ncbi:tetratricopeptide repeat protein [Allofustis seminis]|uniref:tetratricopeptide repeat protein n=1 Tax=Allofustis seminis TaxID=166939 RepID=UPI000369384B|nr:tetratricopeptide repeat protein [Allofustis seminis]